MATPASDGGAQASGSHRRRRARRQPAIGGTDRGRRRRRHRLERERDVAARTGTAAPGSSRGSGGRRDRGAGGTRCRSASVGRIVLEDRRHASRPRSRRRRRGGPRASRRGPRRTRRCRRGGRRLRRAPAPAPCSRRCPARGRARSAAWSARCVDRRRCALGLSISFASPKSRILARPSAVTKMLSGFRSRWTMPFACAAARPCAICAARSVALRGGRRRLPQRRRAASRLRAAPSTT